MHEGAARHGERSLSRPDEAIVETELVYDLFDTIRLDRRRALNLCSFRASFHFAYFDYFLSSRDGLSGAIHPSLDSFVDVRQFLPAVQTSLTCTKLLSNVESRKTLAPPFGTTFLTSLVLLHPAAGVV